MIKLVVTDIDGTLTTEGTDQVSEEIYELVLEMKKLGIVFAAASGREYDSIYRVFEPVKDEMIFIAQNGAYVVCRGVEISRKPIRRSVFEDLLRTLKARDDCQYSTSAPEGIYLDYQNDYFYDVLTKGYKNNVYMVDDVLKADADFVKVSVFQKDGITQQIRDDLLIPHWQKDLQVVVSGKYWIDFMDKSVDKGHAVADIQKVLGISREETMAFGDNGNDIGMLKQAGESYAVANARNSVKEVARHVAQAGPDGGVIKVLKELINTMKNENK